MLFGPDDDLVRYEAKQQKLVDGIIDALHRATRNEKDHRKTFTDVARCLLLVATDRIIGHKDTLCKEQVLVPLEAFTQDPVERKLLAGRIAERIVSSVLMSGLQYEYSAARLVPRD